MSTSTSNISQSSNPFSNYNYGKIESNAFRVNYSDFAYVAPLDTKYVNHYSIQLGSNIYYSDAEKGGAIKGSSHCFEDAEFMYNFNTEKYLRILNNDTPLADKVRQVSLNLNPDDYYGMSDQEIFDSITQKYEAAIGEEFWQNSNPMYSEEESGHLGWSTVNMWFDNDIRRFTSSGDITNMRRVSEYGDINGNELKNAIIAKYGNLRDISHRELSDMEKELSLYNLISGEQAGCLLRARFVWQYNPYAPGEQVMPPHPDERFDLIAALFDSISRDRLTKYDAINDALYKEFSLLYPQQ